MAECMKERNVIKIIFRLGWHINESSHCRIGVQDVFIIISVLVGQILNLKHLNMKWFENDIVERFSNVNVIEWIIRIDFGKNYFSAMHNFRRVPAANRLCHHSSNKKQKCKQTIFSLSFCVFDVSKLGDRALIKTKRDSAWKNAMKIILDWAKQ